MAGCSTNECSSTEAKCEGSTPYYCDVNTRNHPQLIWKAKADCESSECVVTEDVQGNQDAACVLPTN